MRSTLIAFLSFALSFNSFSSTSDTLSISDLMEMSFEELLQVQITSSSLTESHNHLNAVSATVITQEDIELSGARSLDELLEIYVPSFSMMFKGKTGHSIGFRGIISDRNNKILILVNGKEMNNKSLMGFLSERHFTMLKDIYRIEVISSPQSSLYGPGAISAIVSIYTKSGRQNETTEVSATQGITDYFSNIEIIHTAKIGRTGGYTVYGGADYAQGINQENAPLIFGFNRTDGNGDTVIQDEPSAYKVPALNASHSNIPRMKFHTEYTSDKLTVFVRHTSGEMDFRKVQADIIKYPSSVTDTSYLKYRHSTALAEYRHNMGNWKAEIRTSYDVFGTEFQYRPEGPDSGINGKSENNFREDEFFIRTLLKYERKKLSFAIGSAFSHEWFGKSAFSAENDMWRVDGKVRGIGTLDPQQDATKDQHKPWETNMYSGISEIQYSLSENTSIYGGYRLDKHSYTKLMHSPRISAVWKHKSDVLVRVMYSKSNRRADDVELRRMYTKYEGDSLGDTETIDFYELSSDIPIGKTLIFQPSLYYSDYSIVAWHEKNQISQSLGQMQYVGADLKLSFNRGPITGWISHSYIKLIDFELATSPELTPNNNISTMPYGYGTDFHNYPNNITKLHIRTQLSTKHALTASLQTTWRLNGSEDAAEHNRDSLNNALGNVMYSEGSKAYNPTAYLHLGYIFRINDHFKASAFAYHLLGLIDPILNKRNQFQRNSQYSIYPTSFAISLKYSL